MASIPKRRQPPMPAPPPSPIMSPMRTVADLPPATGYLDGEISRLPRAVEPLTGNEELPLLQDGKARRGFTESLAKYVRTEINKNLTADIVRIQAGGGGGRHTYEKSVTRAPVEDITGTEKVLVIKNNRAISTTVNDMLSLSGNTDAATLAGQLPAYYLAWANFTGVPATFTPSAHNHSWAEITSGKPTTLAGYGITDAAPSSHVGAGGGAHANVVAAGAAGFMTGADKTKLDGIATGATANSSNATLLDRANHTGTQLAATVSNFSEAVDDRVAALLVAGTNVTLTYNDGANTLTIDSTSSSVYGSVYRPEDYGAVGDGTTDDSVAFQDMFDAMQADGGLIITEPVTYKINSALDFRRIDAVNNSVGGVVGRTNYRYAWLGYGTILNFKALTGSAVALSIGADDQGSISEYGHWRVYGLTLIGPHTASPGVADTPPTTTTGIKLNWAYNGVLQDVNVSLFYKGVHAYSSFPIAGRGLVSFANYINLHLDDNSTVGRWDGCEFRNGRFGVVMYPTTATTVVTCQTFNGALLEGNDVGAVMDPNTGSGDGIRGIIFDNPYLETITYDGFRVGRDWNAADAADAGDNRNRGCVGLSWTTGTWDAGGSAWGTSGHDAIRFQSATGGDASPSRPRNILLHALPLTVASSGSPAIYTAHTANISTLACGV